jgi:hypothetical protein
MSLEVAEHLPRRDEAAFMLNLAAHAKVHVVSSKDEEAAFVLNLAAHAKVHVVSSKWEVLSSK